MNGDAAIVPDMAPLLFAGHLDRCTSPSDPAWGSGYIALLDWVHRYYNDTVVLGQHFDNAEAYLDYLLQFVDTAEGGSSLLDLSYPGTKYGDWWVGRGAARVPVEQL